MSIESCDAQSGFSTEPVCGGLKYSESDLKLLYYDLRDIMRTVDAHGARATVKNILNNVILGAMRNDKDLDCRYMALEPKVKGSLGQGPHKFMSFYSYLKQIRVDPKSINFDCDNHMKSNGSRLLSEFLANYGD